MWFEKRVTIARSEIPTLIFDESGSLKRLSTSSAKNLLIPFFVDDFPGLLGLGFQKKKKNV